MTQSELEKAVAILAAQMDVVTQMLGNFIKQNEIATALSEDFERRLSELEKAQNS